MLRSTAVCENRFSAGSFVIHLAWSVRVLLIDLEPSDQCDMLDEKNFQRIWEHVLLGSFAGVLLTPPGETWTESSARISTAVRHAGAPCCFDGLPTAELQELNAANVLPFAALLLALACPSSGVRFVLEHASVPVQWLLWRPTV